MNDQSFPIVSSDNIVNYCKILCARLYHLIKENKWPKFVVKYRVGVCMCTIVV